MAGVHKLLQTVWQLLVRCTYVDPDNMVSEEKEDYWVQFDYSVIDDATDGTLHPFNTMVPIYYLDIWLKLDFKFLGCRHVIKAIITVWYRFIAKFNLNCI